MSSITIFATFALGMPPQLIGPVRSVAMPTLIGSAAQASSGVVEIAAAAERDHPAEQAGALDEQAPGIRLEPLLDFEVIVRHLSRPPRETTGLAAEPS